MELESIAPLIMDRIHQIIIFIPSMTASADIPICGWVCTSFVLSRSLFFSHQLVYQTGPRLRTTWTPLFAFGQAFAGQASSAGRTATFHRHNSETSRSRTGRSADSSRDSWLQAHGSHGDLPKTSGRAGQKLWPRSSNLDDILNSGPRSANRGSTRTARTNCISSECQENDVVGGWN
jgi:hypothetical protein